MQDIVFVTFIILGLIGSGFFSGAEVAITSCFNRLKLRQLVIEGDPEAHALVHFLKRKDDIISVTLIGTNVCNVLCSVLATLSAIRISPHHGELWAMVFIIPPVLLFGEILPKAIARHYAIPISMRIVPLLRFSLLMFSPLVQLFRRVSETIISTEKTSEEFLVTKEELKTLVREGKEHGIWDSQKHDVLQNIIKLDKIKAGDVMLPLAKTSWISPAEPLKGFLGLARATGHTRFPVYNESEKICEGIVNIYDLIFSKETVGDVREIIRPVFEIHEARPIDECLREMQIRRQSLAIVKDSKGRHLGIVALGDILEEIVGDIE